MNEIEIQQTEISLKRGRGRPRKNTDESNILTPPPEIMEIENPEIENPEIENPEIENPEIENPSAVYVWVSPDENLPEMEIENPEMENLFEENPELSHDSDLILERSTNFELVPEMENESETENETNEQPPTPTEVFEVNPETHEPLNETDQEPENDQEPEQSQNIIESPAPAPARMIPVGATAADQTERLILCEIISNVHHRYAPRGKFSENDVKPAREYIKNKINPIAEAFAVIDNSYLKIMVKDKVISLRNKSQKIINNILPGVEIESLEEIIFEI